MARILPIVCLLLARTASAEVWHASAAVQLEWEGRLLLPLAAGIEVTRDVAPELALGLRLEGGAGDFFDDCEDCPSVDGSVLLRAGVLMRLRYVAGPLELSGHGALMAERDYIRSHLGLLRPSIAEHTHVGLAFPVGMALGLQVWGPIDLAVRAEARLRLRDVTGLGLALRAGVRF